ncbi:MAG: acetate--CoA ligase family protein [Kiritimatiellia bacterium]
MLESLFTPESVAVIGASRSEGKVGHEITANLKKGGFKGTVIPVNPSATEILGFKCYPDLRSAGVKPDLAVVCLPAPAVKKAVSEACEAGAGAVIVISAGFKETGAEGEKMEKELAEICSSANVPLLGPNCLGTINSHHSLNASFAHQMPKAGNVSVLSQSGAICAAILDWIVDRGLGVAKLASLGNKADISENDLISALAEDPETRVMVGYLESIVSGDEFIKTAEAAAAKKPIVILKAGVTAAGVKAASSHTGSLAGADLAYGAAFRRSGVIRAESFEALLDYATAFSMQPLPRGDRVAIITNAGGPGIMAADTVEKLDLQVCELDRASATALKSRLPAAASVANPIDVLGDADPERYVAAVNAAQDDDHVDAIIVILTPQAMTLPAETARAIAECSRGEKPILVSFMGGKDVTPGRDQLVNANIPDYPSPERAVGALKAMVDYSRWLERPPRILARFRVNRRRVRRIIKRHTRTGRFQIGEAQAKNMLRAYGFNVPSGQIVGTAEEAVEAIGRFGYPSAMKIASPDILHKSDIGGVKLNLESPEAVRDAFDLIMLRTSQAMPQAVIEGVYVEKMNKQGREVILGMSRDPQFGPMLMFGLGGIFVEVMKDVTFHIAPITENEAMRMLQSTKSYALLTGVRGQASVDVQAIAAALQRISQLVTDFPEIEEMDINPFIVGHAGQDSIAADARITLSHS